MDEIGTISFSCKSLFEITADISKILKSVQRNITFIFNAHSVTVDDFVKFYLVLETENVVSLIKTRFY